MKGSREIEPKHHSPSQQGYPGYWAAVGAAEKGLKHPQPPNLLATSILWVAATSWSPILEWLQREAAVGKALPYALESWASFGLNIVSSPLRHHSLPPFPKSPSP